MNPLYKLLQLNLTERVILILRRHWFIFFKKVLIFLVLISIPVIIYAIFVNFYPEILSQSNLVTLILMGISLGYLFLWLVLFNNWVNYYLDLWIVTNQKIISVDQKGLFNHTVARLPITRIQDVKANSKGYAQTFLNFGNVEIQTAGEEKNFIFEEIPNPFKVADQVNDLAEKEIKPTS